MATLVSTSLSAPAAGRTGQSGLSGFDDKDSKKVPGVSYVGKIGDSAVTVVADSVWGAMEGRRVLMAFRAARVSPASS